MSHNIKYADYPEKVDRKKVQSGWDAYVRHEDWQEGAGGCSPIRWLDVVLDSYEDAEEYIRAHDRGRYDCLAVKYRSYDKVKPSEKANELEAKATALYNAYINKNHELHFAGATSTFIGCKNCGSKLAREFLASNHCPLCHADLRPASKLKVISSAKAAYEKANAAYKAEMKREAERMKKAAEVRWLVKIEYHT